MKEQTKEIKDWHELTKMTGGKPVIVERVRLASSNIAIEGNFSLPPLANLSAGDQVFIAAFMRCHGSIKDMEKMFGISYPTVKNRINHIAGQLEFVEIVAVSPQDEAISELERGEITAEEAISRISK